MVNRKPNHPETLQHGRPTTKATVLTLLRDAQGHILSGEAIAHRAQVSRVAVWKSIEALKHAGYPIESIENEGYRLKGNWTDDFLYPWEFPGREDRFFYFDHIDSTMHRARQLAQQGSPGGAVIVAEWQTGPVARQGGRWDSKPGGLYVTLLERPGCPLTEYQRYIRFAQQCLGQALEKEVSIPVQYDWYPDIYVEQKKIAGIVSELHALDEQVQWISIGIGVHVNDAIEDEQSISCSRIVGKPLSRKALLKELLAAWETQSCE
ncbi:biotin--[acetyl-CoA-carboxylase] ligase [Gracilinema caldarium]|uniref:Biotin/acetyl-CoA-carboxylase ligase n=1 Tax=Gracilinema caldarium (strain ATCC 51460 / DSM 7334 / H1) TaxID=744872 RepID=F8F2R3_GRAC1|nr:biotin--[acetyl-CoA-carboxylase] ligase [Gracilinema caldarium]AEJ19457.1 biotin/acetyl-CoA-carboxylase ligase [Gracilinema caldarium DSM 7334]